MRAHTRRLPFIQVEDRALDAKAGLTGLEFKVFCEIQRRARFRGATDPLADTDAAMAAAIGYSVGQFRRGLRALREKVVPGADRPFLRSEGHGPRRRLVPYDSPLFAPADPPAGAPEPARRRAGPAAALHIGSKDGAENVNVARPGIPKTPASPPCPAPPADGIDRDLAGLTADQLRGRIGELKAQAADPRPAVRIEANLRIACARNLLEALDRPATAPTPRVVPPAPRPAPPPAKPTYEALLGRLTRSAGPGPVEDYARFVASTLGDEHSLPYHRKIAVEIRSGTIPAARARAAFQQARHGKRTGTARAPGAIYAAACRRLG